MSKARLAISSLALSAAAFVGILAREGYTSTAIIPTKGDVPTIGFGTTGDVRMGDSTTPVKAVQRALTDSQRFEGALKQCVSAPLHQAEYDVYLDLSYNIGSENFCNSSISRKLNAGQYVAACNTILEFKYAGGFDCSTPSNKRCGGVWTDRLRQHAQCMEAQ